MQGSVLALGVCPLETLRRVSFLTQRVAALSEERAKQGDFVQDLPRAYRPSARYCALQKPFK